MTDKQQIEEMAKVIKQAIKDHDIEKGGYLSNEIAEALYYAGYRKIPEKAGNLEKLTKDTIISSYLYDCGMMEFEIDRLKGEIKQAKEQAVKEFAEKLKVKATWSFIECGDHKAGAKTVTLHNIDETLKEVIGEKE